MKLIKPYFEILEQKSDIESIYKQIELIARTCYKSEDNINDASARSFVNMLISSKHNAMLEHGTVYLAIPMTRDGRRFINLYINNPYSIVNECNEYVFTDKNGTKVCAWCVTTTLRIIIEHNRLTDLEFICEPTKYHEKRYSVRFVCSRDIAQQLTRHRVFSFAMESQRYCNYSKDKFNNELTFCIPSWLSDSDDKIKEIFIDTCRTCELAYLTLIRLGWKAEQARAILPNSTKTEIVMTGSGKQWEYLFSLRSSKSVVGRPHPSMIELIDPLMNEFDKLI